MWWGATGTEEEVAHLADQVCQRRLAVRLVQWDETNLGSFVSSRMKENLDYFYADDFGYD